MMRGWKTWTAAGVVGVGTALEFLGPEYEQLAKLLYGVAAAFGLVGLGHKVEKGFGVGITKTFGLLLAVVLAVSLTACAGKSAWTPPAKCDGQPSLILEKIPVPKEASLILQLANLQLLKGEAYGPDDARAVIDTIEEVLEIGVSYADLCAYVMGLTGKFNARYGAEIFLVSQYLELLSAPLPISDCDKELIRLHLAKQRQVLLLVGK